MDELFDRLQALEDRYEELGGLLSDPDVISDTKRFTKLSKEMADLRETVEKYNEYKKVTSLVDEDLEMLEDMIMVAVNEAMKKIDEEYNLVTNLDDIQKDIKEV